MVKKSTKKDINVNKGAKKLDETNEEGGMSLDDAFGDDEDVSYAQSKPKKLKKKDDEEDEEETGRLEEEVDIGLKKNIIASKPIGKIKKGDKIKIDGIDFEVDAHYVLIDHGSTKEMAIEIFDKNDKDYQLRYFDDQSDTTLDFYALEEIMYIKRKFGKVEW
jgi:hypothetical protein